MALGIKKNVLRFQKSDSTGITCQTEDLSSINKYSSSGACRPRFYGIQPKASLRLIT